MHYFDARLFEDVSIGKGDNPVQHSHVCMAVGSFA
jgi:hypothetical protein